ncbi:MAG: DUF1456 family protein [Verrucomicrobia bacterium]|jgi:uncharacterized protein YehS (DUF1456 family)|nr:DUF1456 family protein [Verrucomicrobiota bacterium]
MPTTNNDVLRRLRYTLDLGDSKMISMFVLGGCTVTRAQVSSWLKREEDPDFIECDDRELAIFLNGLIVAFRGKREGPQPIPETRLNNNIILRKLKIALNLQAEDMLEIFALSSVRISKHELSAFFRKPFHAQYRDCKAQLFRKFMTGLQSKYRSDA